MAEPLSLLAIGGLIFAARKCSDMDKTEYQSFSETPVPGGLDPSREDSYNRDNPPKICFFGKNARWDGYKATNIVWLKLTDFQKVMFITEALEMIEKHEKVTMGRVDGWRLIIALNAGAKASSDIEFPMIKLLRDLICGRDD